MRLKKSFFDRNTIQVAKDLLGKKIVRIFDDGSKLEAIITETEAYHGFDDRASHASKKKTERNKIMFGKAGLIYVYLVYGMHYCLNFVTMDEGFPAAVLIRSVTIVDSGFKNQDSRIIDGPGKLCRELKIDKSFYGEDLAKSQRIWVETIHELSLRKHGIIASERVGVDYAGESARLLWNFKLQNLNVKSSAKSK